MVTGTPALAQASGPLIPDYGKFTEIADPFEAIDANLRYRIVFDVFQPASKAGEVHHWLKRVARMATLQLKGYAVIQDLPLQHRTLALIGGQRSCRVTSIAPRRSPAANPVARSSG